MFFRVLRYAIGTSADLPADLCGEQWNAIYKIAQQQSLLGILFDGIRKNQVVRPERDLLLQWFAVSERIREANQKTNRAAAELTRYLLNEGFRTCILKGQGNTLSYPSPYMRMSGDIDIWVKPVDSGQLTVDSDAKSVIRYVRRNNPAAKACYHHVDAGFFHGIEVEAHYRPSFMNNLIHNHRMQRWFEAESHEQFSHEVELPDGAGRICVPTHGFNRIYQMAHISNHVIHEGIGLRQLVDYYFVLKQGFSDDEKGRDGILLRRFGLYKMASAVMWVLKETLHMDDDLMLVPPDEQVGRFLLNEILLSGNFGHYDSRVKHNGSQLARNIQRLQRDLRLLRYFPSECLWEPVFRVYHFFWRMGHG